ncbi:MAG: NAD-dependent epimerase/dehydratase family protein [Chloroflexi bacterium]|nr:MAG: NAD-dependent epimerase/dehydratase family protein [Chloroflexota bacterium]
MNVLVTGGTGTLGRDVVMLLRQSGHRARILSRNPRGHVDAVQGDLKTGAGLSKALAGMDAIVHAASATREPMALRATDVRGTRRLLELARDANIGHFVYISIVGIEGVAYPYYRIKIAAETLVREGMVPWSILRATQFHSVMELTLRAFARLPGMLAIPFGWQFQPVESREVARRVVDIVLDKPAGMLPDFGGPQVRDFKSIGESWLAARKERRRLMNLWLPFKASRQVAEGRLTCPEHKDGLVTFDQYLAEKYAL